MTNPKRLHHLPEEERPSAEPSAEQSLDKPAIPAGEPSEAQIPSFLMDDTLDELEFDLPMGQNDEIEFDAPPSRLPKDEPIRLPGPGNRRRRRQNPLLTRPDARELGERLESMARRAAPSFDFFLFSLLAGAILGLGYMRDSQAVLLFGVLVVPVLTPWVGVALAASIGEIRFLGQTLGGFVTALFIVFLTGILAGLAVRIWMPITTNQALLHVQLWPEDLLLMSIGTIILAITFIQSEEKPLIASLMVAYEIYLPLSAAGFGLGSGAQGLWPQGLAVLLVHLAVSIILALIVFYYMGFHPLETFGYVPATGVVIVLALLAGYGMMITESVHRNQVSPALPVFILTPTPSATIQATFTPKVSISSTPGDQTVKSDPATATIQALQTQLVHAQLTSAFQPSPTLLPTPVYGKIHSAAGGASIRKDPNGTLISTVLNDYLVEILPDAPIIQSDATWVRVKINTPSRDIVGWVQLNLIVTATPPAPSTTPTPAPASP
jgi:hypothetical protein